MSDRVVDVVVVILLLCRIVDIIIVGAILALFDGGGLDAATCKTRRAASAVGITPPLVVATLDNLFIAC
jgi:hypothetical protein